jgi:hypothetical protein
MNRTFTGARPAVYVLGQRPGEQFDDDYSLCSFTLGYTTACTTRYNASSSGQTLEALCGDDMGDDPDFIVDPARSQRMGGLILHAMGLGGSSDIAGIFSYLQLDTPSLRA